jgi:hypothetical protein
MISVESKGDFKNTEAFLTTMKNGDLSRVLHRYGQQGVLALARATPLDSGKTASEWSYRIGKTKTSWTLIFENNHIINGVPIAILIQYGHGTKNGGYVQGRDFINPAIRPIFDQIAEAVWKEVGKA